MRFRDAVIWLLRNEQSLLRALPDLNFIANELEKCEDSDIINVVSLRLWSLINTYGLVDFMTPDIKLLSQVLGGEIAQVEIVRRLNQVAGQISEYYNNLESPMHIVHGQQQFGEAPSLTLSENKDELIFKTNVPTPFVKNVIEDWKQAVVAAAYMPGDLTDLETRFRNHVRSVFSDRVIPKLNSDDIKRFHQHLCASTGDVNNHNVNCFKRAVGKRFDEDMKDWNDEIFALVEAKFEDFAIKDEKLRPLVTDIRNKLKDSATKCGASPVTLLNSRHPGVYMIFAIAVVLVAIGSTYGANSTNGVDTQSIGNEKEHYWDYIYKRKQRVTTDPRNIGNGTNGEQPPPIVRVVKPSWQPPLVEFEIPEPVNVVKPFWELDRERIPDVKIGNNTTSEQPPPIVRVVKPSWHPPLIPEQAITESLKTGNNTTGIVKPFWELNRGRLPDAAIPKQNDVPPFLMEEYECVGCMHGTMIYRHKKDDQTFRVESTSCATSPPLEQTWFQQTEELLDTKVSEVILEIDFGENVEETHTLLFKRTNDEHMVLVRYLDSKTGDIHNINMMTEEEAEQRKETLDRDTKTKFLTMGSDTMGLYNFAGVPNGQRVPSSELSTLSANNKHFLRLRQLYMFWQKPVDYLVGFFKPSVEPVEQIPPNLKQTICPPGKPWSLIGGGSPCDLILPTKPQPKEEMSDQEYREYWINGKLQPALVYRTWYLHKGINSFTAQIVFLPDDFSVCTKGQSTKGTISENCKLHVFRKRGVLFNDYGNQVTDPVAIKKFRSENPEATVLPNNALALRYEMLSGQTITRWGNGKSLLSPSGLIVDINVLQDDRVVNFFELSHFYPGVSTTYMGNVISSLPRTFTAGENQTSNLILTGVVDDVSSNLFVSKLKRNFRVGFTTLRFNPNELRALEKHVLYELDLECQELWKWQTFTGTSLKSKVFTTLHTKTSSNSMTIPVIAVDVPTGTIAPLPIISFLTIVNNETNGKTEMILNDVQTRWTDVNGAAIFDDSIEEIENQNPNTVYFPAELFAALFKENVISSEGFTYAEDAKTWFLNKDLQHTQVIDRKEISPVYNFFNESPLLLTPKHECEIEQQLFDFYMTKSAQDIPIIIKAYLLGKKFHEQLKDLSTNSKIEGKVEEFNSRDDPYERYGPFTDFEQYKLLGLALMLMQEGILQPFRKVMMIGDYIYFVVGTSITPQTQLYNHRKLFLELNENMLSFKHKFDVNMDLGGQQNIVWIDGVPFFPRVYAAGNYNIGKCMADIMNSFDSSLVISSLDCISASGATYVTNDKLQKCDFSLVYHNKKIYQG
jgi:hypothetical protein